MSCTCRFVRLPLLSAPQAAAAHSGCGCRRWHHQAEPAAAAALVLGLHRGTPGLHSLLGSRSRVAVHA